MSDITAKIQALVDACSADAVAQVRRASTEGPIVGWKLKPDGSARAILADEFYAGAEGGKNRPIVDRRRP